MIHLVESRNVFAGQGSGVRTSESKKMATKTRRFLSRKVAEFNEGTPAHVLAWQARPLTLSTPQ